MTIKACFPTLIYYKKTKLSPALIQRLVRESYTFKELDVAGQDWSKVNYPGGYTSYSSLSKLWQQSPIFSQAKKIIDQHVQNFAKVLEYDLKGKKLEMVSFWINIVPPGTYHGLHLHPISTISGTLYLKTPPKCGKLKLEDPRLSKTMASPPKKANASFKNQPYLWFTPSPGKIVLFESWQRHEVEQNLSTSDRLSLSFNYNWF